MEHVEQSMAVREVAIAKVDKGAKINPVLWAFRNLFLVGVEADNIAIELITDQISTSATLITETGMTPEETKLAEEEAYWDAIREKNK